MGTMPVFAEGIMRNHDDRLVFPNHANEICRYLSLIPIAKGILLVAGVDRGKTAKHSLHLIAIACERSARRFFFSVAAAGEEDDNGGAALFARVKRQCAAEKQRFITGMCANNHEIDAGFCCGLCLRRRLNRKHAEEYNQ